MSKIDTSTIQGYAEMTPEQKIAWFEAYEFNDNSAELTKLQEAVKRSNAENAEYKRKEQARMTDDEKKALADKEMQENYARAQEEIKLYKLKEELLESGFNAEEIKQLIEKGFSAKAYAEIYAAREEKLKKSINLGGIKENTPKSGVGTSGSKDEDDFATQLARERYESHNTQKIKDVYKK
jgi:hypothetical protein